MMTAPDQLRAWLAENRMHGYEFAEKVPVSAETVSRWLTGATVPTPVARARIADMTAGAVPVQGWAS